MITATLIISILTLIATVLFPCISLIKNRLRFSVSIKQKIFKKDNCYYDFNVILQTNNKSRYPITIHKILLKTDTQEFLAYYNCLPLKNKIIDEHEELTLDIVFIKLLNNHPNIVRLELYTNKKNYFLPISLT